MNPNPYGGANGGGINVEPAWDKSQGQGVIVAVIDTGVSSNEELPATRLVAGYDFVNGDGDPSDDHWHGTHVAGTVGQSTNNSTGVAGVAFACSIMPVKVLNSGGSGYDTWIADGICYAADNGANVINLSLGGPRRSKTLEYAVAYAYGKGVTIVASSGNEGAGRVGYPAAYDKYVIAVGATRYDETRVYYSNYGRSLDLVAPGGQIYVQGTEQILDQNNDGRPDGVLQITFGSDGVFRSYYAAGTSMAAPHVSGVAALVIANGVAGPDAVRSALESTAEDKGAAGWDNYYGHGIVDAAAAVNGAGPPNNTPTVSITSPLDEETFQSGATIYFAGTAIDPEDGDISAHLVWTSDKDGPIGAGTSFEATLSDGTHTITAEVADSGGKTGSDSITITVGTPPTLNVEVTTDKVTYANKEIAVITVTVTDSEGDPVEGATVQLTIAPTKGSPDVREAQTNSEGIVTFYYSVNANRSGTGTYAVTAQASKDGATGEDSTTFEVTK